MKTMFLLLWMSVLACTANTNEYHRQISNAVINLKPLYEWDELRGTLGGRAKTMPPRPLTAWIDLHLIIFDKDPNGWLATSTLTNRQTELVLIRNPPPGNGDGGWPRGSSTSIYALKVGHARVRNLIVPVYDHGKIVKR